MHGAETLIVPLPGPEQLPALQALLLSSMAEGVSLSTEDGCIVYTNPAEDRMFGYATGELLGCHVTVLNAYPPEENARIVAAVMAALHADGVWRGEWLNRRKDGSTFYTDARITAAELDGRRYWLCVQEDITERRRAEEALRAAETEAAEKAGFLDAILSTTPDPIYFFDREKRYRFISAAGLAAIGMTADRTIGRTWQEVGLPADVMAPVDAQLDTVLQTGIGITAETEFPAGTRYEYHLNPMRAPDGQIAGVVASSRDITTRQRLENTLRESETRFRQLADSMPQIVWTAGADGWPDYYNRRWYDYTGLPEGSLVKWHPVLHHDDVARTRQQWLFSVRAGVPCVLEYRLRSLAGEYRWHLGRSLPMRDGSGRILHWFCTCTDIHDIKEAEAELARHRDELVRQADELRGALEDREILFKEVHHRVKNNLQVICSLVRMQARRIADQAGQAALEDTYNRIYSISLVHEVLYGEHEAAALEVHAYLNRLCATLSNVYGAPERGISMRVSAAGSLDLVRAVPLGLLANELISNALKHAFPSGGSGTVTVRFRSNGASHELLVADDGIGMPQGPLTPASLGTTIIHALVQQLGATMECEGDNGTLFRITFPV